MRTALAELDQMTHITSHITVFIQLFKDMWWL